MPFPPSMDVTLGSITTTQAKVLKKAYRVLMIAFGLFVITAALPLNLRSQVWGHQFSNAILNVTVLPWLALVLGRLGVTLEQRSLIQARLVAGDTPPTPAVLGTDRSIADENEEEDDEDHEDGRSLLANESGLLFLSKVGFYAMVLLAVWQLVLFSGSLVQIEARQTGESQVIDQRFTALQQQLRQLPPERLDQAFQRLGLGPASADQSADPFDRLQESRTKVKQQASRTANQARFLLIRESLRNVLLAVLYATGFFGLARL